MKRNDYQKWLKDLNLTKVQKKSILKELDRLSTVANSKYLKSKNQYYAGQSDAFGAVFQLICGDFDATDYCE